jgi:hypothetical protein
MLRKLCPRSVYDVMAAIACFGVVAGGTAYAANTIATGDIIDNQVTSADVRDDNLGFGGLAAQDLGPGSVGSSEVKDNSLGNGDFLTGSVDGRVITDNSVASADVQLSSLQGSDVAANTLGGADINESSLVMPPTTTVTFAGPSSAVSLNNDTSFTKVVGKTLPAGSYAIVATANTSSGVAFGQTNVRDAVCELRNGSGFIGGAADRRAIPEAEFVKRTLSMNGGAQVPAGGGEVSLWCKSQSAFETVDYAQMMITRVDGFF